MHYMLLFLLMLSVLTANTETVKVGVLAKRGSAITLDKWNPTAKYLSSEVDGYEFEIVPIDFKDIFKAVEEEQVDFMLTNPGFYVVLEYQFGAQRIVTLVNKHVTGLSQKEFGGVIFSHIDNKDRFSSLEDLKGSTFAAVNERSLGGWQMAWRELLESGIDIDSDLSILSFKGTHDNVVRAVLNREVEIGTVRTDTLERMAMKNMIDLNKIHIINSLSHENFPFFCSTKLYPEWPFSKLKHTSDSLSKSVAIALLKMPSTVDASKKANIQGWSTPLNYKPVHDVFEILEIPPYYKAMNLSEVLLEYWEWILFYLFGAVIGISMLIYQVHLTKYLRSTQNELVEKEKMASLGRLVAGVAHEVNTPIGIGVTAASHLEKELGKFEKKYENDSLTEDSFDTFLETMKKSSEILMKNLDRAASLIQSFKQVSVDQISDEDRKFYIKEYIDGIIISLKPKLKSKNLVIDISCSPGLQIRSTPGVFYQIFTNLILNSVIHGFPDEKEGLINISCERIGNDLKIIYSDNGKGMDPKDLENIFDPFFTTKRGLGGSGLGAHIVYNLVTQSLKGSIKAHSVLGEGLSFIIYLKGVHYV